VREEGGQRRQRLAGLGIRRHVVGRRLVQHRLARDPAPGWRATAQQLVDRQRHRIAAEAFLRDEALGGVGQFLQVLDAVGAFALGLVVLDQAAVLQHQLDDLAQVRPCGLLAQHVDLGDEGREVGAGLAGGGAHRVVQRTAGRARASCSCSMLRAPMPRGGKFTTRRKLVSSFGFSSRRR
jgi:hypothetical protein